jgi:galactitol-specific phosphotransferase system IIB component
MIMQFCDVIQIPMAKIREQKLAEDLYIKGKKTAKEIAQLVGVTEKTVGDWIDKFKWKDRRNALLGSAQNGLLNINTLIDIYAEKLVEMESDPKAESKDKVKMVDAIAKLNKTKDGFEKEHRIPYNTYINVMDLIMSDMIAKIEPKYHLVLLEFFENHTNELALKY